MTPPRISHSRTRYPELGRIPLHRRGTSKTYECLEDLLKEAGYKETRIFTPEADRVEANAKTEQEGNRLSGMGAVVGFLSGFIPGNKSNLAPIESTEPYATSPQEYSPPVSPLAPRQPPKSSSKRSFEMAEPPTLSVASSVDGLGDLTPKASRQQSSRSSTFQQTRPPLVHRNSSQLSFASSRIQQQNPDIASPQPSRAGAYLRHMASAPSMPQRPNSTPVNRPQLSLNDSDAEGLTQRDDPPLPPSWLETVARAVLFGGSGAHIGGPSADAPPRVAQRPHPVLRTTRSSLSQTSYRKRPPLTARSGLSDQTNTAMTDSGQFYALPPPLLSKIERGRSGRSEGEVSMTRVVCRSAPGSRTGSLVRRPSTETRKERGRGRRRKDEKDRLPSLARTQTEGDVWSNKRKPSTSALAGTSRHMSGWGADVESEDDHDHTAVLTGASSEEDDSELDLARILVPPKRQNSIKSLRKHLASDGLSPGGAHATLKSLAGAPSNSDPSSATAAAPSRKMSVRSTVGSAQANNLLKRRPTAEERRDRNDDYDPQTEEWGGGWVRRNVGGQRRGSDDDDLEPFNGFFGEGREDLNGSGRSGTGKSRLGINKAWGLIGGGAS